MEDIRHRTTGPYLPFTPRPLSVGVRAYSFTTTGGLTFGGIASVGFIGSQTRVGQSVRPVGPSLPFTQGVRGYTQGARTYSYSPTGGITFGGASDLSVNLYTQIGWIGRQMGPAMDFQSTPFGYTAPAGSPFSIAYTPSGGITFNGAAVTIRYEFFTASGGIVFNGSSPVSYRPGGIIIGPPGPVHLPPLDPSLGYPVTSRDFNLREMVSRAWGSEFAAPDHRVYEFSNGRGFDSTDMGETGIYRKH